MDLTALLSPEGAFGKLAAVAFSWVVAASVGLLVTAFLLLRRFSQEGPVIPLLLPALEAKWEEAFFKVRVWTWLRRIGLALLALGLIGELADLCMSVHSILSVPVVTADWRAGLQSQFRHVVSVAFLLAWGVFVQIAIGGGAALVLVRARNYVSASQSLVDRRDIARVRKFFDDVETYEVDLEKHGEKD